MPLRRLARTDERTAGRRGRRASQKSRKLSVCGAPLPSRDHGHPPHPSPSVSLSLSPSRGPRRRCSLLPRRLSSFPLSLSLSLCSSVFIAGVKDSQSEQRPAGDALELGLRVVPRESLLAVRRGRSAVRASCTPSPCRLPGHHPIASSPIQLESVQRQQTTACPAAADVPCRGTEGCAYFGPYSLLNWPWAARRMGDCRSC